jgi:hypothetical protein
MSPWLVGLLALAWGVAAQTSVTVFSTNGGDWLYSATGTDLSGTAWTSLGYDTTGWSSGTASLGFGDAQRTIITTGHLTYYFRKIVTLSSVNTTAFPAGVVNYLCDDGAVIYINGVRVASRNVALPASGPVLYTTPASACPPPSPTPTACTLPQPLLLYRKAWGDARVWDNARGTAAVR